MPEVHFTQQLESLKGPIQFTLLNDAVFHIAMNRSPMISLRGLLSDLMEIPFDEITNVEILNPIMQENALTKESILDVRVEINRAQIINIELQTWQDKDWINRSLYYLCQIYSNINQGEGYDKIKPAMHISIMTYSIFPKKPEFYARYRLLNVENGNLYTPNFALNVLDLSQESLATQRDRDNHLDFWAKLFKCSTWEEMRTLAAVSPVYKEVAESMATSNIEPAEVSMARYHDRYVSGMRGSYAAGWYARQKEIDAIKKETVANLEDIIAKKRETATILEEIVAKNREIVSTIEEIVAYKKGTVVALEKICAIEREKDSNIEDIDADEREKAALLEEINADEREKAALLADIDADEKEKEALLEEIAAEEKEKAAILEELEAGDRENDAAYPPIEEIEELLKRREGK